VDLILIFLSDIQGSKSLVLTKRTQDLVHAVTLLRGRASIVSRDSAFLFSGPDLPGGGGLPTLPYNEFRSSPGVKL
jgi:hypothetical protein